MHSHVFVWIFLTFCLTFNFEVRNFAAASNEKRGINGGLDCAGIKINKTSFLHTLLLYTAG
jgi:hypothetical protein